MKRGGAVDLTEIIVEAQAFQMILADRRRVPVRRLAGQLRTRLARVEPIVAAIERDGHLLRDEEGDITAVAGLSTEPTRHAFTVDSVTRWTWCAWDALGIVQLLDQGGTVRSSCPETGIEIVVRFERDGPAAEPDSAVLLFAERPPSCVTVRDWCPQVNLFEAEDAARTWMDRNGVAGELQEVEKAAQAAAEVYRPLLEDVRVKPWWLRLGGWWRRSPSAA